MDCLFCKIASGEAESKVIYEDSLVMAFLDINPMTNGDTLLIPKKHYDNMFDIPNDLLLHMNEIYKDLYPKYQERLNCKGLTLTTNFHCAQEIRHFHMHFIPRFEDDEVGYLSNKEVLEDLNLIKEKLN